MQVSNENIEQLRNKFLEQIRNNIKVWKIANNRPIYNRDKLLDDITNGLHSKNKRKYKGVSIAKHFKGKTLKNKFGECYLISSKAKVKIVTTKYQSVKQKLLLDLKVIPGISDATELNLKREGINSVNELKEHYRFGNNAKTYINSVENRDRNKIYEQLSNRFTSSHPLLLLNSTYFDLSEILFVDIETLGLHDCSLFLIGIATFKNKTLIIDQILLRNLKEEKAALHFLDSHLKDKEAICSFNGKSFDIPFIRKRMERHDLNHHIALPHFDLRYFSTKAFKDIVFDFRLTTLENKLFKIKRIEDIPSSYIPDFYMSYIETKNIGSIIPIINHNKQDLISTAKIFMKLYEMWC